MKYLDQEGQALLVGDPVAVEKDCGMINEGCIGIVIELSEQNGIVVQGNAGMIEYVDGNALSENILRWGKRLVGPRLRGCVKPRLQVYQKDKHGFGYHCYD